VGPLGDAMSWLAAHGPWPANVAPLGAVVVVFAALRLVGVPLHVKTYREPEGDRSAVFALLMVMFDGILLFVEARTAEAAAPALLAGEPWLIGAHCGAAGKGVVAAVFLAVAALVSIGAGYGLALLYDEVTDTAYGFDPENVRDYLLVGDVLVALPAIVGIALAHEKNPFALRVALGYCLIKVLSAAALSTVALTAEWIENR